MNRRSLVVAALVSVALVDVHAQEPRSRELLRWGALAPGAHGVGYQSHWAYDHGRTWSSTFADGTSYGDTKSPRPVLVNAWYPTDPAAPGDRMPAVGYFSLDPVDDATARVSKALAAYARSVAIEETFGAAEADLDPSARQQLAQWLHSPTSCRRDAPIAAAGPFPLLIYHAGARSSFEDNAVLCEYLASHGYVVVCSAFQAGDGDSFNVDTGAGSQQDFAFLIRHAKTSFDIDWAGVGLFGHSAGAQAILEYLAVPGAAVDAAVLLDSTEDVHSWSAPFWPELRSTVSANAKYVRAPLLVVTSPVAFFPLVSRLAETQRYLLTVPGLSHNEFISQGVIKSALDGRRPGASTEARARAGRSRAMYDALSLNVQRFFDAKLKRDAAAHDALLANRESLLGGPSPHLELMNPGQTAAEPYDPASPQPPTPRQLRALLAAAGAAVTLDILLRFRDARPSPPVFDATFTAELMFDLFDQDKQGDATQLYACFRDSPGNPIGGLMKQYERFRKFAELTGDRSLDGYAEKCFGAARALDPKHPLVLPAVQSRQGAIKDGGGD